MKTRALLEAYNEIRIDKEISDRCYLFSLLNKQFLFIAPFEDDPTSTPAVYLYNDSGFDFPHIMLHEEEVLDSEVFPEGKYRWVCLYEHESVVNSLISFEDKTKDAINRLIELLSMNEVEREKEFQKEFMFYWNSCAIDGKQLQVFLKDDLLFSKLDAFSGVKLNRVVDHQMLLSDSESREKGNRIWTPHVENDVYYIPITDCRNILPPHKGYKWTAEDIENIVYAPQIEHLDKATFQQIRETVPKTQNLILVFGMIAEKSKVTFAAKIKCNNIRKHTLLEKLLSDIVSVEPLYTLRNDYSHLNELIGNDVGLLNTKVLLIGAGSLGSYIAFELVKNGVSHLKIYDGDLLEEANILRWAYGGIGKGTKKASTVSLLLNLLHPEIKVEAVDANIEEKDLVKELVSVDLIIFTIGSSDQQIKLNRALKGANCSVPVLFVWVEAGGKYSHILKVDYQKQGCYECLYTDENGNLVNNRARMGFDQEQVSAVIRNGCGGTRAVYGTATLLRTTAALLEVLNAIMDGRLVGSLLFDITPERIIKSKIQFPEEACACCGTGKRK